MTESGPSPPGRTSRRECPSAARRVPLAGEHVVDSSPLTLPRCLASHLVTPVACARTPTRRHARPRNSCSAGRPPGAERGRRAWPWRRRRRAGRCRAPRPPARPAAAASRRCGPGLVRCSRSERNFSDFFPVSQLHVSVTGRARTLGQRRNLFCWERSQTTAVLGRGRPSGPFVTQAFVGIQRPALLRWPGLSVSSQMWHKNLHRGIKCSVRLK